MNSFRHILFVSVVALSNAAALPLMADKPSVEEAYLKAYAETAKTAAFWSASQTNQANAQNHLITAWSDAQAKLINAQAAFITAQANANATNAETLETLEQVRSLSLDNNLKKAKTFYEKRTLHSTNLNLDTRKRTNKEDLYRYSRASVAERPSNCQLDPVKSKIIWPQILQKEQFAECRLQLELLFIQRNNIESGISNGLHQKVRELTSQMQTDLRSLIREVNPAEYLAARKFIDSLAFESQFPQPIEGLANN